MMVKKYTIIGAGPSGLVAAINLAKAGYKVRVYEKNKNVGMRLNGDFQGLENWSREEDILKMLKRMNVEINFPYSPRRLQEVYDCDLKKTVVRTKRPTYYLVRRGNFEDSLDMGLRRQAEKAGVEIIFNKSVKSLRGKGIVATGPRRADVIAVGITFDTKMKNRSMLILDDGVAPKGYAYLLTWNGRGTLVSCMFEKNKDANEYFEKTVEKFRKIVKLDMRNVKHFGGFGNFFFRDSNVEDRRLYVGEAAGFQDDLAGFGMRYAMTSGYLAARSVIKSRDYDEMWRAEFGDMLKTSLSNRFLFERLGNIGYKIIIKKMAGNSFDFWRKQYESSFFKRLIFFVAKFFYWRRLKID